MSSLPLPYLLGKNVFLASGLNRWFTVTVIWGYIVAQFDSFPLLCVGAAVINESEMQYLSCQNSSTTVLILFLYLQPYGWKCFLCNLVLCLENKNLKEHFMSCQIKTTKGMYLRKGSKGSRPPPLPSPLSLYKWRCYFYYDFLNDGKNFCQDNICLERYNCELKSPFTNYEYTCLQDTC